jgi:hypothetical protein
MPEYHSLTVMSVCSASIMSAHLEYCQLILIDLRLDDTPFQKWMAEIVAGPYGESFGATAASESLPGRSVGGASLVVEPILEVWQPGTFPGVVEAVVEFGLLIPTESIEHEVAPTLYQYRSGVGRSLWHRLRVFARHLAGGAGYVMDEAQDGASWSALVTGGSAHDLWRFELALVPPDLAVRYAPLPTSHVARACPEGMGFARKEPWPGLPWEDL